MRRLRRICIGMTRMQGIWRVIVMRLRVWVSGRRCLGLLTKTRKEAMKIRMRRRKGKNNANASKSKSKRTRKTPRRGCYKPSACL